MAKGQKPADQMEAFSKDAMAQAHQIIDTYFGYSRNPFRRLLRPGLKLAKS